MKSSMFGVVCAALAILIILVYWAAFKVPDEPVVDPIAAEEVVVEEVPAPDYVFLEDLRLPEAEGAATK